MRDYRNYTGVNTTEKIKRDAEKMLEDSLNGYAFMECVVAPQGYSEKSYPTEVIFFQKRDSDGESMKMIGRIGEIERGNLVVYKGETYLVMTKPEDNGTYRKAEVHICPTTFPVQEEDEVVVVGLDKLGRPITKVKPGTVTMLPCVVNMSNANADIANGNKEINLLDNQVTITIPYREASNIKHDKYFSVYGETYRIIKLNQTKSIEKIGLLIITGERMKEEDVG